jgi:hypothetical protein
VKLLLSFETTDSRKTFSTKALLDCGATDTFINKGLIDRHRLTVTEFDIPIPVYNADGRQNKLGDITGYVEVIMRYGDHTELMCLHATSLGQERIFLRHDWLHKHNPEIDWTTGEVTMSRCPKKTCGHVHRQKRSEKQKRTRQAKAHVRETRDLWEWAIALHGRDTCPFWQLTMR